MTRPLTIYAPLGLLGYGYPEASLVAALDATPDLIAVDAGSTDPGPYYLGAGVSFTSRVMVKRDLGLLLRAAVERRIPLVVGSAGGAGAAPHLAWALEIVHEIGVSTGRGRWTYRMHSASVYRYYRKHRSVGWRRLTLPLAWVVLRVRAELAWLAGKVRSA